MRTLLCFTGMVISMVVFSQQVVWEQWYDDDSSAVHARTVKFHESTQQAIVFASLSLYPDIISDPQTIYLKIFSYDPTGNLLFDSTYVNVSHPPLLGDVRETSGGKYAWAEEGGKRYMAFDPVSKQVHVAVFDTSLYDISSQAHDGQNRLATLSSGGADILRIVDENLNVLYQDSLPLRYHSNSGVNQVLFSSDGRLHLFWERHDTIRYLKKSVFYNSMDSFDLVIPGADFRLRDVDVSVPDNRIYFYGRTFDGIPHFIMTDLQGNMISDQVITIPGVISGPFLSTSSSTMNPMRSTPGRVYIFDETNYNSGLLTNDFLLAELDRQGNLIRTFSGGTSDNPPHHPAAGIIPLKNDEILVSYFSIQDTCSVLTSILVDPFTTPQQVYTADTCDQLMWQAYDAGISAIGDFYMAYNQRGPNNSTDVRLVKFSKPNLDAEHATQEKSMHIFPNPFMEEIRIMADISQPTAYIITDAMGTTVHNGMLTSGQAHTIQNLSSLAAGTYFMVVQDGKTRPATIVKME